MPQLWPSSDCLGRYKTNRQSFLVRLLEPQTLVAFSSQDLDKKSFSQRDGGALSFCSFTLRTSWLLTGNEILMSTFNKDWIWGPQRESSRMLLCTQKPPFVVVSSLRAAELECAMQLRWSVLASFISVFFHPFISVLLWGRIKCTLSGLCMCFRWLWYSTVAKILRGQNWFESAPSPLSPMSGVYFRAVVSKPVPEAPPTVHILYALLNQTLLIRVISLLVDSKIWNGCVR